VQLTTSAFAHGDDIPRQFTCDGADRSPALAWTAPPDGTRAFALIADDPDAPRGTWVHWVLYNLPAEARELPEGVPPDRELPNGARQGRNDFHRVGYGGPCPPPGAPHRYYFRLFALDSSLALTAGATRTELDRAMERHILARAEVMGRYRRGKG
jgi:Raf kinase inhibitor-like YbhB/YbcL family protein